MSIPRWTWTWLFTVAAALTVVGNARSAEAPRIGILLFTPLSDTTQAAFRAGLREHGYTEGSNFSIEWRSAEGRPERGIALAQELVALDVKLIVAEFTPMVEAARAASATLPIVMAPAGDPVVTGLVRSLARPGGNVTGLTNAAAELAGKRLELLRRLVPDLTRVGLLMQGNDPLDKSFLSETEAAAARLGIQVVVAKVPRAEATEGAFERLAKERVRALIVPGNLPASPERIAALSERHRLPSISLFTRYAEAGGLMSYGASSADLYRRAAGYVDRILKGARPGDLPVERPTKFELVVNRPVATRLGLTLPASLVLQADRVID